MGSASSRGQPCAEPRLPPPGDGSGGFGDSSLLGGFLLVAARKRAYWIGGALGVLALVLRLRRRYLLLAGLLLVSVFAIGYLTPGDFRMRIDRAFAREDNVERIGFWRAGVAMFQERPLFGWGPGGYRLHGEPFLAREFSRPGMVPSYRENFTHVHNVFLQLLVDGGLVLFESYLSLLGYFLALTFRDLWQRGRSEAGALGAGMFAALVTLLFAGLFECNLMDKEVVLPTFFALGTYLSLRSGQAES